MPQRSRWVKESHTTWVVAPSMADRRNQPASATGDRSRHRRPTTSPYTLPRQRAGSSATSGSRTVSHRATSAAAIRTSAVTIPTAECVTSPNAIAPGSAVAAKYVMSGAKEPATRADATSGPRAVPSRRSPGSTAAAWLSVNGKEDSRGSDGDGSRARARARAGP